MIQIAHRTHLRKKHLAPDAGLTLVKAHTVTRAALRSRTSHWWLQQETPHLYVVDKAVVFVDRHFYAGLSNQNDLCSSLLEINGVCLCA